MPEKRWVWVCPKCGRRSIFYVPVKDATCPGTDPTERPAGKKGHSDPVAMELKKR